MGDMSCESHIQHCEMCLKTTSMNACVPLSTNADSTVHKPILDLRLIAINAHGHGKIYQQSVQNVKLRVINMYAFV